MLCHDAADALRAKVAAYLAAGDRVALHVDRRAGAVAAALRGAFAGEAAVIFAPSITCGWGDWSLAEASLSLLRSARAAWPDATHFALGSGDCYPTMAAGEIRAALAPGDRDWIETKDFFASDWIKTGPKEDRVQFRHYVNERRHPALFYGALALQRRLGLRRTMPDGVRLCIGSQWWLLRAGSAEKMLALHDARPDLARFFRRSWIPDETYFQTLAAAVTPAEERTDTPPTHLAFSDYGMPVVFHRDHEALLRGRADRFFARKISRADPGFRARLLGLYTRGVDPGGARPRDIARPWATPPAPWAAPVAYLDAARARQDRGAAEAPGPSPQIDAFYARLALRGRAGARTAPRLWERAAALGPKAELVAVVCKKWHLAEVAAARIGAAIGAPAFGMVFDDPGAIDPARLPGPLGAGLGGLDTETERKARARGMFLSALAGAAGARRLAIGLDPGQADALADLAGDGCRLTVVEMIAPCSDAYLMGHAVRIGLWPGLSPPPAVRVDLLRALRAEMEAQSDAIAALPLPRHVRIDPSDDDPARVAARLSAALELPEREARALADDLLGMV
jgi:hypothetical protein